MHKRKTGDTSKASSAAERDTFSYYSVADNSCIHSAHHTRSHNYTTDYSQENSKKFLGEVLNPICSDGVWALYALPDDDSIKHKLFDDGDIFVHEFEMEDAVTQAWLTKEFKQIKTIVKDENEVYCIDTSAFINPTETYSPEKYENLYIEKETTYTTPTGKTVEVFIVSDGKDELWFSNEVPFSIVKVIVDGELAMSLIDFGFDAERKISREEGENCVSM